MSLPVDTISPGLRYSSIYVMRTLRYVTLYASWGHVFSLRLLGNSVWWDRVFAPAFRYSVRCSLVLFVVPPPTHVGICSLSSVGICA